MKTDSNYKMSKPLRTRLALGRFRTPEQKTAYRKYMKAAEVVYNTSSFAVIGGKSE